MDAAEHDQVAEVAEKLAARVDAVGINGLSPSEQVIVRAWSAAGVISNAGFRYFYEGATTSRLLLTPLRH